MHWLRLAQHRKYEKAIAKNIFKVFLILKSIKDLRIELKFLYVSRSLDILHEKKRNQTENRAKNSCIYLINSK